MAAVAKEIVYEETASGDFAPAPTRSQKRAAKRAAELRRERLEGWLSVLGIVLMVIVAAGLGALSNGRW